MIEDENDDDDSIEIEGTGGNLAEPGIQIPDWSARYSDNVDEIVDAAMGTLEIEVEFEPDVNHREEFMEMRYNLKNRMDRIGRGRVESEPIDSDEGIQCFHCCQFSAPGPKDSDGNQYCTIECLNEEVG